MVDVSLLFGAVLFADAVAVVVLLWTENFTRYEGVVLWEEESPVAPLFWGSVIVLLAGILSLIEIPISDRPRILLNVGGLIAPLAVCALIAWRRRRELAAVTLTVIAAAAGTLAATSTSSEDFVLALPWSFTPAVIAGVLGAVLSRARPAQSMEISYVGAVVGCFVGLDLIPFAIAFGGPFGPPGVSFGAGGILDLVFLNGVVAVALAWVVGFAKSLVRHGPPRPAVADPGDPDALRRQYDADRLAR